LGREPGYDKLRQFLNVDFRHDLRTSARIGGQGQLADGYKNNATEEFAVRSGQYLLERGYFTTGIFRVGLSGNVEFVCRTCLEMPRRR